ncbi:MAG: DUF169 domain-containing protein [Pseudomonadota bacterium]
MDLKKLAEQARALRIALALRGRVVGVKLFKSREEAKNVPKIKDIPGVLTSCQRIQMARIIGWTTLETKETMPAFCNYILGLCPKPEEIETGKLTSGIWCRTLEDAKRRHDAFPVIPPEYDAAVIGPVEGGHFEPDVILIYGTPCQIMMVLDSLHWVKYEVNHFIDTGGSSCATTIGLTYTTGRISLAIPDYGERRYGHVQEDELVVSMRPDKLDPIMEGLEGLGKIGLRYPLPFWGIQSETYPGFPESYKAFCDKEMAKYSK